MFPGVGRGEGNLSWLRITKEILVIKVCSRPIMWSLHPTDEPVVCAERMDALEQDESLFLVFVAWDKLSVFPICMKGACSTAVASSSVPGPKRNVLDWCLGNRRQASSTQLPSSSPFLLLLLQLPFSLPGVWNEHSQILCSTNVLVVYFQFPLLKNRSVGANIISKPYVRFVEQNSISQQWVNESLNPQPFPLMHSRTV